MIAPLVIGNWKMNMLVSESCDLALSLVDSSFECVDVVIAPPFTSIYPVSKVIKESRLGLAGQNFFSGSKGAYTGEVSIKMLKDVGCSHVIIGHSERRQLFGECDENINRKVHFATQMGITAVVCVGETQKQREEGNTLNVIKNQISKALIGISGESLAFIVIAYEPIWAIGTGINASPVHVVETHKFIRKFLFESQKFPENVEPRIIYGGSVNAQNCKQLLCEEEVDGALVGGASLNFESFYAIIKSCFET
jgi:triosephosphate isomerase (TIM)